MWDLFQSESAFLRDHLMAIKNVFMEPLKKVQVEGYVMFAEPEVLPALCSARLIYYYNSSRFFSETWTSCAV